MPIDSTPEVREDRMRLAGQFLDEVLLPRIAAGNIRADEILDILEIFKDVHPGSGSDFGVTAVHHIVTERNIINHHWRRVDPDRVPENANDVSTALTLLSEVLRFLAKQAEENNR